MRSSSATAPARPSNPSSTASAPPLPTARPTPQRVPAKTDAATNRGSNGNHGTDAQRPAEQKILFQKFFKSVGPRTYAAQVKEANNGNHFLVLTEGKRDDATGDVRKTRLFVFSEDFAEFFDLLEQTARFIKAHPVPEEVEQRRRRFWAKKRGAAPAAPAAPAAAPK
jgi:hypothetical protein